LLLALHVVGETFLIKVQQM
jgi:hypothetical protein